MHELKQRNIFFVSPHSLFDRSSGAAISVHTLLTALTKQGWRATALQATIFDAASGGANLLQRLSDQKQIFSSLEHRGVIHYVMRTSETRRLAMTALEQERFMLQVFNGLKDLRPDILLTYGGYLLDRNIIDAAHEYDIPVVFYLANGNYNDARCFKNVDLIVTDSKATAELYRKRFGLVVHPMGKFIDPIDFKTDVRKPHYITFINPSIDKGVNLFAAIAKIAAREIPAAEFLVVQSRSTWEDLLQILALDAADFTNVRLVPLQHDMREVYSQTRMLLVPSLWHESGARVITEALLNGIPVLASNGGGIAEMMRGTGFLFDIPPEVRDSRRLPAPHQAALPWIETLKRLMADQVFYADHCARAESAAATYGLDHAVSNFLQLVQPWLSESSGRNG